MACTGKNWTRSNMLFTAGDQRSRCAEPHRAGRGRSISAMLGRWRKNSVCELGDELRPSFHRRPHSPCVFSAQIAVIMRAVKESEHNPSKVVREHHLSSSPVALFQRIVRRFI